MNASGGPYVESTYLRDNFDDILLLKEKTVNIHTTAQSYQGEMYITRIRIPVAVVRRTTLLSNNGQTVP